MNKVTKFLSVALLSTALVQQVFAQGQGYYAPNGNAPSGEYSYTNQPVYGNRPSYNQPSNAGQRGNIVPDPDNVEPFQTPDGRFEQRNAEFRRFTEKQCPASMHFTQPNHPSTGPESQRQESQGK